MCDFTLEILFISIFPNLKTFKIPNMQYESAKRVFHSTPKKNIEDFDDGKFLCLEATPVPTPVKSSQDTRPPG